MAININVGPERVQVDDAPLGVVQIPGASISTAAMLIATSKSGAPVNSATAVRSLAEFEETFGDVDDMVSGYEDGYYAVKGYFDNCGTGNTVYIVNIGSTPTANAFIGSSSALTGLRALDPIDVVGLVMVPGLPLELAYLVQPSLIDYAETVRTDFGSTLSTVFSLMSIPKEITRANTDTLLSTAQLIEITGAGPWVMNVNIESTAVAATGTVQIVDYTQLTGKIIAVGGTNLTEGVDWTAATSNDATATSLASAIDALASVSATASTSTVNIEAEDPGVAGNSITLTTNDAVNAPVSGATLTGGLDGDVDLSEITAGMIVQNVAGTYTGVISAVNDTADTVTVITNPTTFFSEGDDVLIKLPSAVTYKEKVINNPSRVAAWFFNSVSVLDLSATADPGDLVIVDPIGHVAGVVARIDANISIGGPSHAPAGIKYAGLSEIKGLALSLSERLDAEPLRKNYINRLTAFGGSGNVIFGGYSAESGTSPLYTADERLIQVMRSLQYVKASLEPGLRSYIWENFSPSTQAQVYNAVISFLRSNSYLFPAGLPESQQFKVISVTPTQDDLDNGVLRVRVQLKPNKAIRFIEITLEYPLPTA